MEIPVSKTQDLFSRAIGRLDWEGDADSAGAAINSDLRSRWRCPHIALIRGSAHGL